MPLSFDLLETEAKLWVGIIFCSDILPWADAAILLDSFLLMQFA